MPFENDYLYHNMLHRIKIAALSLLKSIKDRYKNDR